MLSIYCRVEINLVRRNGQKLKGHVVAVDELVEALDRFS